MSYEYEKINIQEFLPILDNIKIDINALLQMKLKERNTEGQVIKDGTKKENISSTYERQESEEDYRRITEKLKAKTTQVREKEAEILNLESSVEDWTHNCKKLERDKLKLSNELKKVKEEHSECKRRIREFSKKIVIDESKEPSNPDEVTNEKYIEEFNEPHFQNSSEFDSQQTQLGEIDLSGSRDFERELECKNKEIEELKQKCHGLEALLDAARMEKLQYNELRPNENQKRISNEFSESKILKDVEIPHIRRHSGQPCPTSKRESARESTGVSSFLNLLYGSPKNKTSKSELGWSLLERPYPDWWTKHMIN